MKRVVFSSAAEAELADAVEGYELSRPGLGAVFESAVEAATAVIQANPAAFGPVYPPPCRRYVLPTYDYSLVYAELPTFIRIVAVAHNRRRPGYWRRRLRP